MSGTSSVVVDAEREHDADRGSAEPSAQECTKIEALRQRSQRLTARLQNMQREMETSRAASKGSPAATDEKVVNPPPQRRLVEGPSTLAPATSSNSRQAVRNAVPDSAPAAIAMSLPYHLTMPSYSLAVPFQQPLPPMQIPPNTSQQLMAKKKSKRTLRNEVEALQEMVKLLSQVSSDVNVYAAQLIHQNEILSQLEWTHQNNVGPVPIQAARRQLPQRIDGGSEMIRQQLPQQRGHGRHRLESEVSNTSSNSNPVQQQQKPGRRQRNRKKSESSGKITTQSLKTELEALRLYINKIVQHHVGTDHLPPQLIFKGDFSDLEDHAQRLTAAGYGRIVEEEIRVNRKNNRQAFITMSTDREALDRDGIVLLPVARRYAFEGDKVRAFVLNAGAQCSSKPESSGGITGGKPSLSLADDVELSDDTESQDSEADVDNVIVISSDNCPKAFVIAITKQTELRQIVGTISFTSPSKLCDDQLFYKFRPYDLRVPMVYVPMEACAAHIGSKQQGEVSGLLYLAHILETDCNGHCIAELIQPVGRVGNLDDELKAILFHNNLRDIEPFEQRFKDMYSQSPPVISKDDLRLRRDLRKTCIFTIDPMTARDLDDAVSIEKVGDNKYEVGVHISDVSHYLIEGNELDNIVKKRSTSIYLANEVIHMLPESLCMRCSLLPGEDKFAFSVFWKVDGEGVMQKDKPEFSRTVINSCSQFAYEHAQKIIDNPNEQFNENDFPTILNGFQPDDIKERILLLHTIASSLRKERFNNGAITINNAKLRFILDPVSGEPLSFEVEKQREANRMIEEFMLLANQAVARFVHDSFPEIAVLRNHPPPLTKSLKALREKLLALGFDLDYSSSKALQESMLRLCNEAPNPVAMKACLSQLLMKPMARATYFCSEGKTEAADLWHYALSIPIYTHFTSPIRRYPDIMVHRLLAAALKYCPPPGRTPDELHALTKLANERKYNAKLAGEDSGNLYFKRYVRNKQGIYMRAVVMEIFQHMMNVVTLESGHVISINYKMQKVIVDTQSAPNYIMIAERNISQSPRKLQLLSLVPICLTVLDNKLTGFLTMGDQSIQIPKDQPGVSGASRRNKPKQHQPPVNQNHQQQRLQLQLQQQQRMFAMRQNSF
ncbi:DIS3-like exonuclease 2 [Drosophila ficusphila]|uniref:DIS3-like exonuclease 2 n=1 Tax=Drosophila ficusphila TaxID=30025 RepID=UPI0007E66051|nr:DIS3-like exonuclease 2 [Drosophila ficusphila]